ncbi:hypothetical protein HOA55_05495 [archaeon]|nr:hypothetical protein [archaeon]MBT3577775.1 hypothetical protein [archaeon]MBT6820782.1 hypothetical protein [archaeon]MBT6956036.1 hypothetical protein [archaeon]MBT7025922.1 hypothetical protein [archaeon]
MAKEVKSHLFNWKWFILLIAVAVVIWLVWFFFFGFDSCESWECFNDHLEECSKARFIGGSRMIFDYTIYGDSGDSCEVGVELLQGELDNQDSIKMEGHKMKCNLPLGVVMIPESNIGACHGLLKEGLQDLIIEQMHTYIVQNLGRINLDLLDPTGIA